MPKNCPIRLLVLSALVSGSLCSVVHAQDSNTYGDWTIGVTKDKSMVYAGTVNDSGGVFAEYCQLKGENCYWELVTDTACDPKQSNATFPALGNTDSGAAPLTLACDGTADGGKTYRYIITNWKDLEALIARSTRVGFALPLGGDRFKAIRFSLNGMKQATDYAESAAARVTQSSTRDQSL